MTRHPSPGASQRFGAANALEGIAQSRLDQFQQPLGCATFRLCPVAQVFQKLGLKHRDALGVLRRAQPGVALWARALPGGCAARIGLALEVAVEVLVRTDGFEVHQPNALIAGVAQ